MIFCSNHYWGKFAENGDKKQQCAPDPAKGSSREVEVEIMKVK